MFAVFTCLAGIAAVLLIAEFLWRRKILKGENQRKFVHICAGTFIAFWPWIISWEAIQIISIIMAVVVLVVRQKDYLHFLGDIRTRYYGDVFWPLAVILTSLLTTNKVFFAIAILHVALADGFAAVVGVNIGKNWSYKIVGQTKTVLGSMTFWIVSVCILGVGLVLGSGEVPYNDYVLLLLALPPILTLIENISPWGLDNITIPLAVIAVLNLAAT